MLQEVTANAIVGTKGGVVTPYALKMGLYGAAISGPLGHFLYTLLDHLFAGRTSVAAGLLRLLAVNVGVIPVQMIVYFVCTGLIMGLNKSQVGGCRVRSRSHGCVSAAPV